MNVFFHNFDPSSNSGPNKFTRQLFSSLETRGLISVAKSQNEADAEFALIQLTREKRSPVLLRLDGIYFNQAQNYEQQNAPIKYSYQNSDCVVFQSNFNKKLTEAWFGKHKNSVVIHNAPDVEFINSVKDSILDETFDRSIEIWSCASSWRPHKRLEENLRYFIDLAPKTASMIVAGKDADMSVIRKYNSLSGGRIYYVGELDYYRLISLYKRSSTFVHLSYLDHCPNVVVDAQASGCKIICSSSGGTKEIVTDGIAVKDRDWNYEPIKLYEPPALDFSNFIKIEKNYSKEKNNITSAANLYLRSLSNIVKS